MNPPNWAAEDYETARNFIYNLEEKELSKPVLDAEKGVTVIFPAGLPLFGIRFHGIFMLAPLLVFMGVLIVFPLLILGSGRELNAQSIILIAVCAALLWGITKAFALVTKNRDLFPRNYFVTLGTRGPAMHFSRWHFPGGDPKAAFLWKEGEKVQSTKSFFLPALLIGNFQVTLLEIISVDGRRVKIPLRRGENLSDSTLKEIESLIRQRMEA